MACLVPGPLNKQITKFTDPRGIPDCILWLDAADSNVLFQNSAGTTPVILTGQTVAFWRDKSSRSNNASNTANQPTASFAAKNGYTSVLFSGTQTLNLCAGLMPVANNPLSVFVVSRVTQTVSVQTVIGYGSVSILGGTTSNMIEIETSNAPSWYVGLSRFIGPTTDTAWTCLGATISRGKTVTTVTGGPVYDGVVTTISTGTRFASIGSGRTTSDFVPTTFLSGEIGEIIMYNRALTFYERNAIEGYLAWKWGINLSLPTRHGQYAYEPHAKPFHLNDVSGLAMWLDGYDRNTVSLTVSGFVTNWNDKSPFVGTFGPSGTTSSLSYSSNFGVLLSATLSASLTRQTGYPLAYPTSSNIEMFFVLPNRINASGVANQDIFTTRSGGNSGTYLRFLVSGMQTVIRNPPSTVGGRGITITNERFNSNGIFHYAGLSGGATSSPVLIDYNAFYYLSSNNYIGSAPTGGIFIGAQANSNFYRGYISEYVAYNDFLTNGQREQVFGYLANKWKWSLSLATNLNLAPSLQMTPTFQPMLLSGCLLWIDASDPTSFTLSTGNIVTSISDKSNMSGSIASVLGAGYYPGYSSNGFNGRPCFTTDTLTPGKRLYGTFSTISYTSTSSYAIFMALNATLSVQSNSRIFSAVGLSGDDNLSGTGFTYYSPTGTLSTSPFRMTISRFTISVVQTTSLTTSAQIITIVGTPTLSGTLSAWQIGGSSVFPLSGGGALWGLNVGELLMYRGLFSYQDIQRVQGYLAWKWGLQSTLSSYHGYRLVGP
jgi:hypothetical protein